MNYDKGNMLGALDSFPRQVRHANELAKSVKIKFSPSNIVICGMGGSGLGGKLITKFESSIPIISHNDYGVPKEVNSTSLVIVISYSGNTEEAISSYEAAKRKGAKIITISSGGKLKDLNKNNILVPGGYSPRAVAGYLFVLPLMILSNNGFIENQNAGYSESLDLMNTDKIKNLAENLAKKIKGRVPVFYSGEELKDLAYSFKTHVNENAKQPAFNHVFPEMNHNEILAFKKLSGGLITVFIENKNDHPLVIKGMGVTKLLLRKYTSVAEIEVKGKTLLARMLYTMYIGDFTSYFLAIYNKIDPSPVDLIDELKKRMSR